MEHATINTMTLLVNFKEKIDLSKFYEELTLNKEITSIKLFTSKLKSDPTQIVIDVNGIKIKISEAKAMMIGCKSIEAAVEVLDRFNLGYSKIQEILVNYSYNIPTIKDFSTLTDFKVEQKGRTYTLKYKNNTFFIVRNTVTQISSSVKEAQDAYNVLSKYL